MTGSKAYSLLRVDSTIDAKDIDGLTIYKHSLIGHQSSKVVKFHLNEAADEIKSAEILDSGLNSTPQPLVKWMMTETIIL